MTPSSEIVPLDKVCVGPILDDVDNMTHRVKRFCLCSTKSSAFSLRVLVFPLRKILRVC